VAKQTILIVDDELIFVRSVKNFLLQKRQNYAIKTAYNGREALNILDEEKIDLVILDINMPVVDGIQFLMELHNKKLWLPIIILTGVRILEAEKEVAIFKEYGIVEYMGKPIDFDELKKKIEEVLNHFEIVKKPSSGISIPTILRVIESEKRTGVLTIKSEDGAARIFFRNGKVIDAESKGLSSREAFDRCLKPEYGKNDISIEYINHKRGENPGLSFYDVLLEKFWLVKEQNNPKKDVVSEHILKDLNLIAGFIAAAVYDCDGEILSFSGTGKPDLQHMGKLAVELFVVAENFSLEMDWGSAEVIEIKTPGTIFMFVCIKPGRTGLGIVMSHEVNMGRVKLVIREVVKKLKEFYALPGRAL
jgi:DNA-binding response OmpR family regulator/predicted regulator of Ras-like GTPase activity (Roadblock/LC7/MglB family)